MCSNWKDLKTCLKADEMSVYSAGDVLRMRLWSYPIFLNKPNKQLSALEALVRAWLEKKTENAQRQLKQLSYGGGIFFPVTFSNNKVDAWHLGEKFTGDVSRNTPLLELCSKTYSSQLLCQWNGIDDICSWIYCGDRMRLYREWGANTSEGGGDSWRPGGLLSQIKALP